MADFKNKRYTTWSDESSGVHGRYRPTTYGVYDNYKGRKHPISDCKYSEAEAQAIKLNEDWEKAKLRHIKKLDKRPMATDTMSKTVMIGFLCLAEIKYSEDSFEDVQEAFFKHYGYLATWNMDTKKFTLTKVN